MRKGLRAGAALLLGLTAAVSLVDAGAGATAMPTLTGCDASESRPLSSLSDEEVKNVAAGSAFSEDKLRELRADETASVDSCGGLVFVEGSSKAGPKVYSLAAPEVGAQAAGPLAPVAPLSETFTLESLPGSNHTIYLNFKGDTVKNTVWNGSKWPVFGVKPFGFDGPLDESFSDAELTEIQRIWMLVSEDFAPFDVNVVLQNPGSDALGRSDRSDPTYGMTVDISSALIDPLVGCGCKGQARVGVFGEPDYGSPGFYGPAFVNAYDSQPKVTADAISHELGHTFGLSHDGRLGADYYYGDAPWAPIMGVGYEQPVSQWSKGEYPGATNTEDDVAIIARAAPLRSDDHGDTRERATALAPGKTVNGVIASEADADAFTFTGAGTVTLTAAPALAAGSNLDIELTVLDANGAVVATVDRPTERKLPFWQYGDPSRNVEATGLDAVWTAEVPKTGKKFTAVVRGAGHGTPGELGSYSRYGSIGAYQLSLTSDAPATAPGFAQVSGATGSTVGIDGRGKLYGWGYHYEITPVALPDVGKTFTQVSTVIPASDPWEYHFLALSSDGEVYAWGVNTHGELGQGSTSEGWVDRPTKVPGLDGTTIVRVAVGDHASAAVAADGRVYTWGSNLRGALGTGSLEQSVPTPAAVHGLAGVVEVVGGSQHFLARTKDGEVYGWGGNYANQLGTGRSTADVLTPVRLPDLSGRNVIQVATGGNFSMALSQDGTIWSWGDNRYGQLAQGDAKSWINTPTIVDSLSGKGVVSLALGDYHGLALTGDHRVLSWGHNDNRELGLGFRTVAEIVPARIEQFDGVATGISASAQRSYVFVDDGGTYNFGWLPTAVQYRWGVSDPVLMKFPAQ
ncbi:hypothetical protein [Leifsonia xyli]|uniref:RCC1 domain-containing protein n=1 Tax=Leifsonia xyli TaxID=1575 RepID=UPI003D66B2E7